MSAVLGVAAAVLAAAVLAWCLGWLGGTHIHSPEKSQEKLTDLYQQVPSYSGVECSTASRIEIDAMQNDVTGIEPPSVTADSTTAHSRRRDVAFDAAIPGALSLGVDFVQWASPDPAVLAAVQQATGHAINSTLDLHQALAAGGQNGPYQLWTHGSLVNWRGHVFEHQVAEQVASWAPNGSIALPEDSNFAGADLTVFGKDFQLKTNQDFGTIDNIHGDPLIVPDGTEGLPEDAYSIDFSQPFDLSDLEGHDVIVAEGLTAADAAGAWEDAAGPLVDGIGIGDATDVNVDLLLPGVGSALRVVSSGAKRRAALMGGETRAEAAKRVARDAGEGAGLVLALGLAGAAIGGSIDAATMGATLGLGLVTGKALGAMTGGVIANRRARHRDVVAVTAAADDVAKTIGTYGHAVEDVETEIQLAWQEAVQAAEARAARLVALRRAEITEIIDGARRALQTLARPDRDALDEALQRAERNVRSMRRTGWSLPALRRRARWLAEHDRLPQVSGFDDLDGTFIHLVAAPAGLDELKPILHSIAEGRGVTIAAVDVASHAVVARCLVDRQQIGRSLQEHRHALTEAGRSRLREPLKDVQRATTELKAQLRIAGKSID